MREESRLVRVKVIPNSDRSSIRKREDEIRVKVKSPAEKGKADQELLNILNRAFGTRNIEIMGGKTKRRKIIRICGDPETIEKGIQGIAPDRP